MLALIAVVIFVLAAFGVDIGEVRLVPLGLAFLAAAALLGPWPFGGAPLWPRRG